MPFMLDYLCILQTLDIVAENPDKFKVVALAAGSNVTLLADQVISRFYVVKNLQYLIIRLCALNSVIPNPFFN
jgi:hypothetical protein